MGLSGRLACRGRGVCLGLVLAVSAATVAGAQTPVAPAAQPPAPAEVGRPAAPSQSEDRSLAADIATDFSRFFTSRGTYQILAVGLTGSLSAKGFDKQVVASPFNAERFDGRSAVDAVFDPGAVVGGAAVQAGAALTTYGLGAWLDKPGLERLGRDLVRAQVLTQSVTLAVKYTVQRTRPDSSGQTSFPSGHTSSAFATATVLQSHYGWKAGVPAYAAAAYVAASRLSENKHYLSDVVFGAAIGLAAGRTVGFTVHRTTVAISPLAVPGGAGVTVVVSR